MSNPIESNSYIDGQQDWIDAVALLVKTIPIFQSVNLIVEGCIGGNEWCAYWLSQHFPNGVYVGTDLAPAIDCLHQGRVDDGITAELYAKLLAGQAQLRTDAGDSALVTLRANCLSPALVRSLQKHSGATKSMLVTFNGLVGLMGKDFVPGESKEAADLTPDSAVVTSHLYDVQLHVTESKHMPPLWESPVNVVTQWYFRAEKAALAAGISVQRIKDGLVIFH